MTNEKIELHTYGEIVILPKEWLQANIDESVNAFLNSYTWDEAEWLYILYSVEKEEREKTKLAILLKEGITTFGKGNQEGILHPCTRGNYKYQFTFFDKFGAVGDIQKNSLDEMASSIYEYGFKPQKSTEIIN